MKIMLLILIAVLGMSTMVFAAQAETITLKRGQQKTVQKGEVTIKFVTVTEDSRCPVGTQCVWEGNAKVQVRITNRHGGSKTMVMNTGTGPHGDQFNGWAIYLNELTPKPKGGTKINPRAYVATFSVTRLMR